MSYSENNPEFWGFLDINLKADVGSISEINPLHEHAVVSHFTHVDVTARGLKTQHNSSLFRKL